MDLKICFLVTHGETNMIAGSPESIDTCVASIMDDKDIRLTDDQLFEYLLDHCSDLGEGKDFAIPMISDDHDRAESYIRITRFRIR